MDARYNFDNFIVGVDKAYIQAFMEQLRAVSTLPYTIPVSQEYKLYAISHSIYGNVNLKSILIHVNDIFDLGVLRHGYTIYYPSIRDVLTTLNQVSEVT